MRSETSTNFSRAWLWPGVCGRIEGRWQEAGWIADKGAGKILKDDVKDAGLPISRKAAGWNEGQVLDFPSFHHTFGISLRNWPKELQMRFLKTESETVWRTDSPPNDFEDLQERIHAINSRESLTV